MIARHADSYSGRIDWNDVYRRYYQLDRIEERLQNFLPKRCDIALCGFAEIASMLSVRHTVHFIEYSESMVQAARREFSAIRKISHGDILDRLPREPARVIFVVCRVSAYWQNPDSLMRFLDGVRQCPRDLVVVDFFDAARLESNPTLGGLAFSDVRTSRAGTQQYSGPAAGPLLATVSGAYEMYGGLFPFRETRAFYNPSEVLAMARHVLDDLEASIELPVIEADPGFALVLRSRVRC